MLVPISLLAIVLLMLFFESFSLKKSIKEIPVKILVNGTRGKSSVVKYISILLRTNNKKTFSKITGIVPTSFSHDGKANIIKRRGGARVTEQFGLIRKAAKIQSDAVVLECMSINPEFQRVESNVLKPDYYIITNIREDHLEEMGRLEEERVESICSAIPNNCTVFTAEKKYLHEIKKYASAKNSRVVSTDEFKGNIEITNPDVHVENVKLALLISKELKLQSEEFLNEINKDLAEDNTYSTVINNYDVKFYNAFAVNDVPSAESFYEKIRHELTGNKKIIIIFNSRSDRPFRSVLFAKWFAKLDECSYYILTGDHVGRTKLEMLRSGIPKNKILKWVKNESRNSLSNLRELINEDTSILGLGNIKSEGFEIIKGFKSAAVK